MRQDLHSHSIVIRNNRVFFPDLFSRCLACLRNEAIITFSESDLSFACAEMAEWLEVAAPENMEQRLCALFLAVRLAQHVGLFAEIWCDVNGFVFHFGLCFHVLNKWMISCAECHSAFPPRRSNKSRSDEKSGVRSVIFVSFAQSSREGQQISKQKTTMATRYLCQDKDWNHGAMTPKILWKSCGLQIANLWPSLSCSWWVTW